MINMFYIKNYKINTKKFSNLLHDNIVKKFEKKFAKFVGAKYSCSFNSATNAIYLSMLNKNVIVKIPSTIPPVVLNAIIHANNTIDFTDNVEWVGNSYILHEFNNYKIIDSAHKIKKNQFKHEANPCDLIIFSFYPTKPIGCPDGGMIVSNDKNKIDWFKKATTNGTIFSKNSWEQNIEFPGWKMYMNSIQAYFGYKGLKRLKYKTKKLKKIKKTYNKLLNLNNKSLYLYRITVKDNINFINFMNKQNICCGIHYSPCHLNPIYNHNIITSLPLSEQIGKTTASIPFHEKLTKKEIQYIVKKIYESNQF